MSQAMYSAMSGMNAAQTKINVVADNIANMNTVGFKQSSVQFSDIYYNTISAGGAPTANLGGTNPKQIGTGVRTSAIARDFTGGSAVTTGISTHLSIKGNGFFTVMAPDSSILFTRAGNFTIDGEGYLVLPNGYKALGTDSNLATSGSNIPVKIPPLIKTETTPSADAANKALNNINGASGFTSGDIKISINGAAVDPAVQINETDTLQQVADKIQTALGANGTAEIRDGKLVITQANPTDNIVFENGTSNFVTEAKLNDNDNGTIESKILDYHQTVNVGTDATNSEKATAVDIYENGIVEVTYANGDKLSVMPDPKNSSNLVFKYTTGNPAVTITGNDLEIPEGVAVPANFQLQMASFTNPNGLIGVGSNAFKEGPNTGLTMYGNVASGAFGAVTAGEYEGSNVDLAEQFADMVVSQRMIEANSRVFDTSSQIMKTLSYLGQ